MVLPPIDVGWAPGEGREEPNVNFRNSTSKFSNLLESTELPNTSGTTNNDIEILSNDDEYGTVVYDMDDVPTDYSGDVGTLDISRQDPCGLVSGILTSTTNSLLNQLGDFNKHKNNLLKSISESTNIPVRDIKSYLKLKNSGNLGSLGVSFDICNKGTKSLTPIGKLDDVKSPFDIKNETTPTQNDKIVELLGLTRKNGYNNVTDDDNFDINDLMS